MNIGINKKISENKLYQMANSNITYYDFDSNYICEYSSYDKVRLVVVFSGLLNYTFASDSVNQTNTDMFLLPQYSHFTLHVVKRAKLMIIEVDDSQVKSVYQNVENTRPFNDAINNPKLYVDITYTNVLFDSVQKIHSEYVENKENPYLVELNVCRLLFNLLNTEYAGYLFSIRAHHPMEQVRYYIERNLKESIKINDLAELVGMTGPNLTNTFKRHFGQTPISYINECKMKFAEELLKESSVTEVAFDMGFENVSTFIAQFKKIHEVTPKQFQMLYM